MRTRAVSVSAVFAKRGYVISHEWEFPLTFYQRGANKQETEKNRLTKCIKLTQVQVDQIELTCKTEDEVLSMVHQLVETGDFPDPEKERVQAIVEEHTSGYKGEIAELRAENKQLMEKLDAVLTHLGQPTVAAASDKPARAKPVKQRRAEEAAATETEPKPE